MRRPIIVPAKRAEDDAISVETRDSLAGALVPRDTKHPGRKRSESHPDSKCCDRKKCRHLISDDVIYDDADENDSDQEIECEPPAQARVQMLLRIVALGHVTLFVNIFERVHGQAINNE